MSSPYLFLKNTILIFEVENLGSDVLDSSGNPEPNKKLVKLEAYMKPNSVRSDNYINKELSGTNFNETTLSGYLVIPDKMPRWIKPLDKTVEATYRGQKGIFTMNFILQSSVKADLITGHALSGKFKVLGGV